VQLATEALVNRVVFSSHFTASFDTEDTRSNLGKRSDGTVLREIEKSGFAAKLYQE
jgi:hypothetical protein